jgi:thioredoxin-like negative regulator of GroEL
MDAKLRKLTERDFKERICSGLHVVEFSAPWCGPAKDSSFFEEEMPGRFQVDYSMCDVEENPLISSRLGVFSVPTWIFFDNGEEVDRFLGYDASREFIQVLEKRRVRKSSKKS